MTITVTRLRPVASGTDDYNAPIFGAPAELDIEGCGIAPRMSDEDSANSRQGVPIGWDLYAPHSADIEPTDRIRTPDGTVYDIDGEPAVWTHMMTGWRAGQVVALKTYEG